MTAGKQPLTQHLGRLIKAKGVGRGSVREGEPHPTLCTPRHTSSFWGFIQTLLIEQVLFYCIYLLLFF